MKNKIINTFIIVLWVIVGVYMVGRQALQHLYPATMVIDSIVNDTVTMYTEAGFLYAYSGASDEEPDEVMSVLMFDNFTPDITDDIIVDFRCSGF